MNHEFAVFHECQMKECAQYFECEVNPLMGTLCQMLCGSCRDNQKRREAKK